MDTKVKIIDTLKDTVDEEEIRCLVRNDEYINFMRVAVKRLAV